MFKYAGGAALKGATSGINFGSKAFVKQTALDGILGMVVGGIDGYSKGESGYDLAKTSLKSGVMFGGMNYFMSVIQPLRNPLKSVFSKESSEVFGTLEGKMSRNMFEIPEGGVAGDNRGNFLKGETKAVDGAPEPEVQSFIEKFKEKYPGREYKSGHKLEHSDGRNNIEIDFETDNAILESKRGNGRGLTRQITDRLDPKINPNGKVVIGVPGSKMSRFAQRDVENAGGLMSNDIDLILELIKPDK
ncbi:hypothetical protein SAMN02745163_01962 [Clostridium cavendishii DSM 21758]|uniref:Uncharacterized protein n=1 Tax=Clostridium cavendishii DSM 21758 TaxID=1121302 RepID=A0A1M6JA42_9CLOT|nr:hypothetical protein [Clostridium cavendishii]SHJ43543.1 hypothetical protein SAMN02745163_01962 [Clostridium cavendishii DSM 21758]